MRALFYFLVGFALMAALVLGYGVAHAEKKVWTNDDFPNQGYSKPVRQMDYAGTLYDLKQDTMNSFKSYLACKGGDNRACENAKVLQHNVKFNLALLKQNEAAFKSWLRESPENYRKYLDTLSVMKATAEAVRR